MRWRVDSSKRWELEVSEMNRWFPTSQWYEKAEHDLTSGHWEVIVEPIPPSSEAAFVLADLDRDGLIDVEQGGRLRHSLRCHAQHHLRDQLQCLVLEDQVFLLELTYRPPPGHPKVKCIEPKLSKATLPGHPHFYYPDVVCPLFPPDVTWEWSRNTAADYLMHVAVWLVKTVVWNSTKDLAGHGIWLGPDVGHTLDRLLRTPAGSQCVCGSGQIFRKCCLNKYIATRMRQRL